MPARRGSAILEYEIAMDPERDAMVKAVAERIRRRHRELSERATARRARAQVFARELAGRLAKADERVEKIVGFGSTFETWRIYRLDSDIDIGVVGGDWFTLTAAVPASEFDVSIESSISRTRSSVSTCSPTERRSMRSAETIEQLRAES